MLSWKTQMARATQSSTSSSGSESIRYSSHFYSLDVLRGLASLCVVIAHWHFFFYQGTNISTTLDPTHLPLYPIIGQLYWQGWHAVDLFFCLSGFIFFWLYGERIGEHKISVKEFAVLRFSRLYPLHFVTLLFVAVAQFVMFRCFGSFYVYPNEDFYHFCLQLVFASSWGFEHGLGFNGPIWSVSVEVLLYAIFFIICVLRFNRWWYLALFSAFSVVLAHFNLTPTSRGVLSFMIGGIAYHIFSYLWSRGLKRFHVLTLLAMTILLWIFIPLNRPTTAIYKLYESLPLRESLMFHHKDVAGAFILMFTENSYEILLYPATILTLAVCEAFRGTLGKRLAILGNISYSTYLIHFPLIMIFMFVALTLSIPQTFFLSPWVLLLFFCLLIPLSMASFYYFELPAQKLLRRRLLPAKTKAGASAAS